MLQEYMKPEARNPKSLSHPDTSCSRHFTFWRFRVQGLGIGLGLGLGLGDLVLERLYILAVQGSGFRVQGSGFRVQGSGFRVQGLGDLVLKPLYIL
jgi:hypothetical protein